MTQPNEKNKLKPFDNSLMDDLSMYDKMPYTSNYDLCNSNTIGLQSGNLLKSYRIKESEPYIIKQDEASFRIKSSKDNLSKTVQNPDEHVSDQEELSKEQLDSLLKDNAVYSEDQESIIDNPIP